MDFPFSTLASKALDAMGGVGRFLAPPGVEVVPARTKFGWAGSDFMVVLSVRLRNESDRPVFLKSLRLSYAGVWYSPGAFHSDRIQLAIEDGAHTIGALNSQTSAIDTPRIPPMEVVERYGVFRLPRPAEQWPKRLSIVWEAAFSRRRNRRGEYTINERN